MMDLARKALESAAHVIKINIYTNPDFGLKRLIFRFDSPVTYGCGTSSTENCTYFTTSNPSAGACSHKVHFQLINGFFRCLYQFCLCLDLSKQCKHLPHST